MFCEWQSDWTTFWLSERLFLISLFLLSENEIIDRTISLKEKSVKFIWRLKKFVLSITSVLLIKTIVIVRFRIKNRLINHVESYVEFLFQLIKKNSYRSIRFWFWNVASKFIIKIRSSQDELIENRFELNDFDMSKNILNVHAKITLLFSVWHDISLLLQTLQCLSCSFLEWLD